jgi:thiol:disulfide interchange protein
MRLFRFRQPNLRTLALLIAAWSLGGAGLGGYLSQIPAEAEEVQAAPKKPNSLARLQPTQATFTTSVSPAEAKAGETVSYQVTVKLAPSWHIYKFSTTQPMEGPRNTEFDFFDLTGLKPAGAWTASHEPIKKKEPAFPNLPFVEYYENEVTWAIALQVPPGTPPGKKVLRNQINYQLCDPNSCKNPFRYTLPEAVLTVLPGGAAAASSPPPSEAASKGPINQVEQSLAQGLGPFLLLAVTGGLLALVMPCVWPMVPITVNFFVKQGEKNKRRTVWLAFTYALAIVGIFTLVGVLFSAVFGASSLQKLANRAWLNGLVAGLFLAFGLSLLGLFEFRLPSFLLNFSSRGESRGGLIGVIFMALTLTITSFTCTFPVVGGLLVMAAGGSYFYPILGLATFATVLAFPFLLLALSPGLLARIPKSGDWMNTVKVVGGLAEIGAAFKFINTAECAFVVPEDAWFDAQVVLTIWVILSLVCGIYLLGLFRTDHDHDAVKVGPGRILIGSLFLFLGLYLSPALFGRPPQSQLWSRVIVGILPADAYRLDVGRVDPQGGDGSAPGGGVQKIQASSPDPKVAIEQEKTIINGVVWGMSYKTALEEAKRAGEPVLIDFTGVNCANCRLMERNVLPRPEVVSMLRKFRTIELYTDFVPIKSITADQREQLAVENQLLLADIAGEATNPFYVALSPTGEVLGTSTFAEPARFLAFLNQALAKFQKTQQVAQADPPRGQ